MLALQRSCTAYTFRSKCLNDTKLKSPIRHHAGRILERRENYLENFKNFHQFSIFTNSKYPPKNPSLFFSSFRLPSKISFTQNRRTNNKNFEDLSKVYLPSRIEIHKNIQDLKSILLIRILSKESVVIFFPSLQIRLSSKISFTQNRRTNNKSFKIRRSFFSKASPFEYRNIQQYSRSQKYTSRSLSLFFPFLRKFDFLPKFLSRRIEEQIKISKFFFSKASLRIKIHKNIQDLKRYLEIYFRKFFPSFILHIEMELITGDVIARY